ncbi:MAG: zinc ABC transporter substrate-binding protein [Pseudomonadales bacterium]|nr:zinc ABC transporter substrate-binding protein [Pseudomonadales bacterium]
MPFTTFRAPGFGSDKPPAARNTVCAARKRLLRRLGLGLCCCLSGLMTSAQADEAVMVSATIKPLQLIAAAITDGVSVPRLLLQTTRDPHHHALRPSERAALDAAQLLVWIGPQMESYLAGTLPELDAAVLTAMDIPGLTRLPLGRAHDPHIWLDSNNAVLIATALTQQLASLDPGNARRYQDNLLRFRDALGLLSAALQTRLNGRNQAAYGVYHNAFQYFERQFGLQHVLSFTDNEELAPGIRGLLAIKRRLQEHQVACLLVEPAVNLDQLDSILESDSLHYGVVDVLGSDIPLGPEGYGLLLQHLADVLLRCLGQEEKT